MSLSVTSEDRHDVGSFVVAVLLMRHCGVAPNSKMKLLNGQLYAYFISKHYGYITVHVHVKR